jgi:hypothetical protein
LGGAADYNSFAAEDATVEMATHLRVFNLLLAETRVEGVKTDVLLATNAVYISRWNRDNLP